ncbi:MAG: endonuclease/exonuclease/phosphatase family protein [Phycisphaerales bacterium JB039]
MSRAPAPLRRRLIAAAWLAAAGGALAIGAAALIRTDPADASALEAGAVFAALLVQTFTFHFGLVAVPLVILALLLRRRRLALALAMVGLVALGPALLAAAPRSAQPASAGDRFVLLSCNLLNGTADPDRLMAWIDQVDPDVILLQEFRAPWSQIVAERLRTRYPHIWEYEADNCFGEAVLSRTPLIDVEPFPTIGVWPEPNCRVAVEHEGRRIELINVHLAPPVTLAMVAEQRRQIAWLADEVHTRFAAAPDGPEGLIIAGDFNAPAHTNHVRELRQAGLREAHAAAGAGRGATWKPRGLPFSLAPGVRLDNAMFGGKLRCISARVGPDVGSDHRPIAAEFIWTQ